MMKETFYLFKAAKRRNGKMKRVDVSGNIDVLLWTASFIDPKVYNLFILDQEGNEVMNLNERTGD